MYIQKAEIKNIRSIIDFEIEYPNPAGWHVLIGDNGAGKSTIIRSMALALVGNSEASGMRPNWNNWLNDFANIGSVKLELSADENFDFAVKDVSEIKNGLFTQIDFSRNEDRSVISILTLKETDFEAAFLQNYIYIQKNPGLFSAAYGPYRRFEGGKSDWESIFKNPTFQRLAAHLSVFDESVALTEPIIWLKELNYKSLEQSLESLHTLENLKKLINSEDKNDSFLPHNARLESVSSEGVFFKDGNGTTISVNQMSDGYRSILSMTFELIRQLVRVYGSELVFKNIEKGEMFIDLPGVVLVDEIDAHLHPTWQTRIGQWFLKYFPRLQFIVTTHSPLVCRAAEKGSIWRLAAPGSEEKSGEITGLDRERLIYGNVLDAYGTEVFGRNVDISEESVKKQETLAKLSKKQMLDDISPEEKEKLENLKKVFTTDAPIEL